jgi:thiol-disulfide isomerase/thioredoxin
MPVIHIPTMKSGEQEHEYKKNKQNSLNELNKFLNGGKDVYVLIYMNGCGPCEATKPKWHEIKQKYHNHDDICVADIEHTLLDGIQNELIKKDVTGFPTMRHIKGAKVQDYEDVEGIKKDRSLESFIEWMEKRQKNKAKAASTASKKQNTSSQKGGKTRRKRRGGKWSLKYKRSINCRKPKGFSQKQHCKYGRRKLKTG